MTQRNTGHRPTAARLSRQSLHLAKEVRTIQHRAAEHDGRIVSIGPLVFFSTNTGDAWMLEPADQLAARLAVAGDPLPVQIQETDASYAIGWQGRYQIDGDTFIYEDNRSGRLNTIHGYPLKQLRRVISEADRRQPPEGQGNISNMFG
jgi:hypothetical protein